MKILLTGASGLLGRPLYKELCANGTAFNVIGTAFSRSAGKLKKLDITDSAAVNTFVTDFSPDMIIHAAAERRPDEVKADPEKAARVNVGATVTLAAAAAGVGASLLYISTNYVFDGTAPPYYPDSETNPLNTYGEMKLAGEKAVVGKCPDAFILRIPILYGPCEYLGESAVTLIAEEISADKPSFFDNNLVRFPTHSEDIAKIIAGLCRRLRRGERLSGIFQCSSEKPYTKYGMAKIMAKIMGINPELIKAAEADTNAAPRPQNAKLDTGRLEKFNLNNYRDFIPAVEKIIRQNGR
ncbi:MAG: SDR family oxidoreductase [Spirochaetales bacterium]|uniref:dTDP-4-dehydrorhamnose reductase n=1 Tax=Candidatus Thalassospirochaeta sargassi TaxID=3119039 RepID=A0AAJ1IE85_9SPIO|nr:SDR family oxidoreductase [Spirochaetales bacterium]